MTKVSVTIKARDGTRTYTGDYTFVTVLNESGTGSRWVQEPNNWMGGLGLFSAGVTALQQVAEEAGDERFKLAARAALDAMAEFDPSNPDFVKSPKRKAQTRTGGRSPGSKSKASKDKDKKQKANK